MGQICRIACFIIKRVQSRGFVFFADFIYNVKGKEGMYGE